MHAKTIRFGDMESHAVASTRPFTSDDVQALLAIIRLGLRCHCVATGSQDHHIGCPTPMAHAALEIVDQLLRQADRGIDHAAADVDG